MATALRLALGINSAAAVGLAAALLRRVGEMGKHSGGQASVDGGLLYPAGPSWLSGAGLPDQVLLGDLPLKLRGVLLGRASPGSLAGTEPEEWVFGEGSAFLVGPVVGRVTESSARVLVESAHHNHVKYAAYMDGQVVYRGSQRLSPQRPAAFTVHNLEPGRVVTVLVTLGEESRRATFRTPCPKPNWRVGAVSCNNHKWRHDLTLWDKMGNGVDTMDVLLHMGDQIYGDYEFSSEKFPQDRGKPRTHPENLKSAWVKARAILEDQPPNRWEGLREKVRECYRVTYRRTWSHPPTAKVLASVSNLMIWDDHEVVDNFGDEPEHHNRQSVEFFIISCAYQVYLEYQMQLVRDCNVRDYMQKAYYAHRISPKVGVVFLDLRGERSIHKPDLPDVKNRNYLGVEQWAWFERLLEEGFKDVSTILLVAPTPIVFLNTFFNIVVKNTAPDVCGFWAWPPTKQEQVEFCRLLSDWQDARPDRAVCVLAGDIHVGGFSTFQARDRGTLINQMISSAVGNMPEQNVPNPVGKTALLFQELDRSLEVNHKSWVWKPNFGILDISLRDQERAAMMGYLYAETHMKKHKMKYKMGRVRELLTNPETGGPSVAGHISTTPTGFSFQ